MGLKSEWEARKFLAELKERFQKFGLTLHPDKTRLIEFGRFAASSRKWRGQGKPETFDFLRACDGGLSWVVLSRLSVESLAHRLKNGGSMVDFLRRAALGRIEDKDMDRAESIFDLSVEEKLQLVEDLWDDLGTDPAAVPIHDWQKAELDKRKQRLAAAPTSALRWDEVKTQVRNRRAR